MEQPFAASYWGFTFGVTALATAPIRMIAHGETGAIAHLAPLSLLVGANIAVGLIALGTLRLIAQRRLLSAGRSGDGPAGGTGLTDHFIWPSNLAAPLAVFDINSSASRPPAA
jgi:hypothetical protein